MQFDRNSASHCAAVGILNTGGGDCTLTGAGNASSVIGAEPTPESDMDNNADACWPRKSCRLL